jgi:electron transport complex protein RnfD
MIAVTVVFAVGAEFSFNLATKKKQTVLDLSAAVTVTLLALGLPTTTRLWQCAVGAVFAIVVVKCLFGGIGYNFANPAVTARVFLLLAFSVSVGGGSLTVFQQSLDLVASATPLEALKAGVEQPETVWNMLIGNRSGAIGESSILMLTLGGIYLIARRIIYWQQPAIYIGAVYLLSLLITQDPLTALYHVLGGGLVIAAFFMITDYVTTPINVAGKLVFAFGCGVITVLIRFWGSYPEGVSFAILLMNILSPYIEKLCTKKPFGKVGK